MSYKSPPNSAETKLFGEVPLSDSENSSQTSSPGSVDLIMAQNERNNARNDLEKAVNGNTPNDASGKTILDVAVIDIDEGKSDLNSIPTS